MRSIKSYPYVAARAFLSPHPKPSVSALRGAMLCLIVITSCTPSGVQPNIPNTQSSKVAGAGATEINNALATIAMQTSLPTADYQIGPEDLLQITLFNVSGGTGPGNSTEEARVTPRSQIVRVSQPGLISLPLIGEVKVSGLTVSGLERELRKQYDKYIYNPQVGVLITEHRQRVSVVGAVLKPGIIELTAPKTVFDILAMVGGVTEKAGTQVHIYRQGPKGRESQVIDLLALASNAALITADGANLVSMPVQGGDIINVPPAGMFFVDGAVGKPGSYPLGRRYSLTQALAIAGGVNRDLNSADITIFRRKGPSGVEPMTVDLDAILANSAVDPKIEEDDVIVVPISSMKYVYQKVFGQLLSWGTTIGAVAGS
jgi:polysaccharide export outer membrane protein